LPKPAGPAFIYSGNGSQWAGMGKRLLGEEPVFREAVREVDALFRRHADIRSQTNSPAKWRRTLRVTTEKSRSRRCSPCRSESRKCSGSAASRAAVVAGHSVGEVAAAWASGALSLAEAVEVIYQRSRLQGTTKGQGQMCAVALGQAAAQALLDELGLSASLAIAGDQQRAWRDRRR
jgi:phthiocerol/phenolphthiocerol synthesis type-I polyketide synthase C